MSYEKLAEVKQERPLLQRLLMAAGVLVAVVVIGAIGVQMSSSTPASEPPAAPVDMTREVVYEVEGDGVSFDLTAETPTGSTQQSPDLPMRAKEGGLLTFEFPPDSFVYISAQNKDFGREITCRITVDGVVISENSATGRYSIATCDGVTP